MEKMLDDLIQFLLPQSNAFLYVFLFLSAVVENLFPPIPGDTITAFGAFLVGNGRLHYLLVYLATTAGSVVGFMLLYLLAVRLGRSHFLEKDYRFFPREKILAAESWFSRYGYFVVLANRFLPGIRSVISLVSGISQLHAGKVLALATVSALVWNLIWIQAGYMLGNNWDAIKTAMRVMIRHYNMAAGILLAAGVIIYIVYRVWKKIKQARA